MDEAARKLLLSVAPLFAVILILMVWGFIVDAQIRRDERRGTHVRGPGQESSPR